MCNVPLGFGHTTICQYFYYNENVSIEHIVLDGKAITVTWKMAEILGLTILSFAMLLFLQMTNCLKLTLSCKDISDLTHQHFPTTHVYFEERSTNLDSHCELVLPACSLPALRSPGTDPVLDVCTPRIPLSRTQAAVAQKTHFQVFCLVEFTTKSCPSSLYINPWINLL